MPTDRYPKGVFQRSKARLQNFADMLNQRIGGAVAGGVKTAVEPIGAMYQAGKEAAAGGMGGVGDTPLPMRVAGAVGSEGLNQAVNAVEGAEDVYPVDRVDMVLVYLTRQANWG